MTEQVKWNDLIILPAKPKTRPEHESIGDPCRKCDLPARWHRSRKRPEHDSLGNPCAQCGLPAYKHRNRKREKQIDRIIGIDGEGAGRKPHLYNYLCASDELGEVWDLEEERLSTEGCLELILSLPKATIVAYSFQYDLTKILEELSDKKLFKLFHPEKRRKIQDGKVLYRRVKWKGYWLNWMNGRFTVGRLTDGRANGESRTIWDIWRFFQSKFTKALTDWHIADEQKLERMLEMKAKRGAFEKESFTDVKEYCREECLYLARLFRALLVSHDEAGLTLKSYYGAGSTSSALLKRMGIREVIRSPPEEMNHAIACAFIGGRFENSHIGPVVGPLFDSDISSAYPYHATLLPCLLHGTWSHNTGVSDSEIQQATLALVHWSLPHVEKVGAWGPFPVRGEDGRVVYPWSAVGGWVWGQEFLKGRALCPQAIAKEAWLYQTNCSCRPFGLLPEFYLERIRVGKTSGRGKVFKLGPNGVYGKLAQTVGYNPPFQCFIWAGVITSNTRAQLLDGILSVQNQWDILAVATDGILSQRQLHLPSPKDTGTGGVEFPLGGWEQSEEGGRFLCRPGISFPLWSPKKGVGKVKSRGYGKKALEDHSVQILEAWERGHDWTCIYDGERFGSAIGSINISKSGYNRAETYGDWFPEFKLMSFDPAPKRVWVEDSNRLGLLTNWKEESYPYDPALSRAE